MADNQLAEDVGAVHDYIDEHGWCQNRFYEADESACLLGAAAFVLHGIEHQRRYSALWKHLEAVIATSGAVEVTRIGTSSGPLEVAVNYFGEGRLPMYHSIIPHYNDRVLKSKEEALEFLAKAQIAAEEKA